jgi:hypothetical protein
MRIRRGGIAFLAMAITLVIAMLALPVFAANVSTLFAGTDAADQAIQAQQYALIEADTLRATAYDNLENKAKANIASSAGFQREVLLGAEGTIDGTKQRIATINIYRENEAQRRYALSVPLSTAGSSSGVPVGTIIIWGAANNPANGTWLDCNGQSTAAYPELAAIYGANVPDYRGTFLRGYGSITVSHGTYGTATHTSGALGAVQGDTIRNITGRMEHVAHDDVRGILATGAFQHMGYIGRGNAASGGGGDIVEIDASLVVPTASENRPVNKAVRYLIKAG